MLRFDEELIRAQVRNGCSVMKLKRLSDVSMTIDTVAPSSTKTAAAMLASHTTCSSRMWLADVATQGQMPLSALHTTCSGQLKTTLGHLPRNPDDTRRCQSSDALQLCLIFGDICVT